MDRTEKADVQELVSAAARLGLWLADELEPVSSDVAERDLDALYELCIAAERKLREYDKQRAK